MKLIVACDPKGGIGYQNKLPWSKIEGDLPRFKELTTGKKVVMGRKTFESLPIKPLPNRINYVLSKNQVVVEPGKPGVMSFSNLSLMDRVIDDDCWVIGGAKAIQSCWDKINEIHLTKTFTEYTCDTYIDLLYLEQNFNMISEENNTDHVYQIWKRK
jgi:dihydrofolate reductase